MELCSLHPFDEARAFRLIAAFAGDDAAWSGDRWELAQITRARQAIERVQAGQVRAISDMTHALAMMLANAEPSFAHAGLSLTAWEARVDRGVGMLLRPPSRLLIDGGLAPLVARQAPIRLELSAGMMGGAFIPARLVPDLQRLLDSRLERTIRRLIDAEYDAIPLFSLMYEAAEFAASRSYGLYEAMDVADPAGGTQAPNGVVMAADPRRLDKALRSRLAEAAKPPKKPGFFARLRGKGQGPSSGASGDGA